MTEQSAGNRAVHDIHWRNPKPYVPATRPPQAEGRDPTVAIVPGLLNRSQSAAETKRQRGNAK